MTALRSLVDAGSDAFAANDSHNRALAAALREKAAESALGGSEQHRARHVARGKLLPRERVDRLLDPGAPFLEIGALAANGMYDDAAPGAGMIAGGLAELLRALDQGEPPRLTDPREAAWQWRGQAAARAGFAEIDRVDVRTALGDRLGLTADHILGVARDCPNAQAFAMRVVPAPPGPGASVTLSEAEALLTELEGQGCGIAA